MERKVCILTSGGDAPGMNQCIMAFVRASLRLGLTPIGVYDGLKGLVEWHVRPLDREFTLGLARRGGTVLGTARYAGFLDPQVRRQCAEHLRAEGVEAVVMLGGDGTQQAAKALDREGIRTYLIPSSIDNDVPGSEFSLGFFTAVSTVVEAVDRIRDTMESHNRLSAVQTMGRHCPDLALYAGVASGADLVLTQANLPPYEEILARVKAIKDSGQRSCLIVLSEHLLDSQRLVEDLARDTGWEARLDILGHTQRGGSPSPQDRILAQVFGADAAERCARKEPSGSLGIRAESVVNSPFDVDNIRGLAPRSTKLVLEAERKAR